MTPEQGQAGQAPWDTAPHTNLEELSNHLGGWAAPARMPCQEDTHSRPSN